MFTTIYASPFVELRAKLWREMESLSLSVSKAWMMAKDLNDIRDLSEKKGELLSIGPRPIFLIKE